MKTLEEKEIEFSQYIAEQMIEGLTVLCYDKDAWNISQGMRTLTHNLTQDFKEEIEGFNSAMEKELSETKEQLDKYKDALEVYYNAIHGGN